MNSFLRISTALPNFLDKSGDGMSYYCDIHESADWANTIYAKRTPDILNRLTKDYRSGYVAADSQDKEISLLICYRDDDEDVMYCCIDHDGRPNCEPAANEALWHAANAAADLPNSHRLPRLTQPIALG